MSIVSPSLVSHILESYGLPRAGTHGVSHWARVLENGRRLAQEVDVDTEVVDLFAIFHDSRRRNEGWDDGHGRRGADLAHELRGLQFALDDARFALLCYACQEHTAGLRDADPTVQVCWDSDRLDLLRVGTRPRPDLLCTEAARLPDILDWANRRASIRHVPQLITDEWGLSL